MDEIFKFKKGLYDSYKGIDKGKYDEDELFDSLELRSILRLKL